MSLRRSLALEYHHQPVSQAYPIIVPPSFPCHPGSSIPIDRHLEGSSTKACVRHETGKESTDGGRCRVTIDILPDVALLETFDFYVNQARKERKGNWRKIQAWHTLVHVCQKWRIIVFESPRRLNLQLYCTDQTPVKETLGVWPPLPIVVGQYSRATQMDNIIVALEHNDRVCQIDLGVTNSQLEEVLAAMQQPFPALTHLTIWVQKEDPEDEMPPVVSKSFLGGSAPLLQFLRLGRVLFPGLPKLLLSATDLVSLDMLDIWDIPHSGYISPEAIVACLSTLTRLEELSLGFESPVSRPDRQRRRPQPTRSALPALTGFRFIGVSEYLEDLVARIDAPLLDRLDITFFHQLIFDIPQLAQFVARTPNIQPPVEPCVEFTKLYVNITSSRTFPRNFVLRTRCRQSDWKLSFVAQVCNSSFPKAFIASVERLYIREFKYAPPDWQDDIEDNQWLEVLHPFTALKHLRVSREFVPRIAPVFQELVGEHVAEVLPALQSLRLEELHPLGPVREAIEKFVDARRLTGHPIAVSYWDGEQGLEEDD